MFIVCVEKPSCIEEREAALRQNIQDPNGGTFITSCTTDGLWSRIQCHNASGFCWCVDQSTGAPISGTSILKQIPDCNAVKVQRQMKGQLLYVYNVHMHFSQTETLCPFPNFYILNNHNREGKH